MSKDTFSRRKSLTYIAVALIIGVTAPFAASAATGNGVNIIDPVYATRKARINASGQILTNTVGTVSIANGSVATAPRGTPFNAYAQCSNAGGCSYYFPVDTVAKTYHLTGISVALNTTTANPLTLLRMEWGPYAQMYTGNGIILNSEQISSANSTNYYAGSTPVDMAIQVPASSNQQSTAGIHVYASGGSASYTYVAFTGYVY